MNLQYVVYICLYCVSCHVTASDYFAEVNRITSDAELLTNATNINSVIDCAVRCAAPECVSFTYNSDTNVCSTFSIGLYVSSAPLKTWDKYFHKQSEPTTCAPVNVYGKPAKCGVFNGYVWTIAQRRYDGNLTFDKTWNEFKEGFGDLDGEYWIGNEALHRLTHESTQIAMFLLEDWNGVEKYAQYDNFTVSSETDKYRLTATGYSGTAGDCLSYHNGKQFSTKDSDNDGNTAGSCSQENNDIGFWHDWCVRCNINAVYVKDMGIEDSRALTWRSFSNKFQPLRKSTMMLRRIP